MGFFIFPYVKSIGERLKWGLQALLLPMHTCKSANVIRGCTFLELIYLFCMNCDYCVPCLTCPEEIIGPDDVDQVLTQSEFVENLINERDAALKEKDEALKEKEELIQKLKDRM